MDKRYKIWDKYPKVNLEDGEFAWANLATALFDDDDSVEMPPQHISIFNPTKTQAARALGPTSFSQLPWHLLKHGARGGRGDAKRKEKIESRLE